MAHPQNSARGLKQADAMVLGPTGLYASAYSTTTALVDANTTGLTLAGQIRLGSTRYIGGNSTGFIFTTVAAKPAARSLSKVAFLTNSTGVNAVMVNTTGTTWKYLNVTSVLPT